MLVDLFSVLLIDILDKQVSGHYVPLKQRVISYIREHLLLDQHEPQFVVQLNLKPLQFLEGFQATGCLQQQLGQLVHIRQVHRRLWKLTVLKVLSLLRLLSCIRWVSFVVCVVVKRTLNTSGALFTLGQIRARRSFIERRMVLLLFPAVALRTVAHLLASLVILCDENVRPPAAASDVAVVLEELRVPAKVLVVVGVGALGFVVLLVEGTPLGLVVKHEEIGVSFHVMDQSHLQLLVAVGE